MTVEMVVVLALAVIAIILFATERLPVDLVALLIMGILLGSGILSVEEGLSGFSNTATITVGAMFVLSAGLFRTGAVSSLGLLFTYLSKHSYLLLLLTLMVISGVVSAFINNTATVAILMPVILSITGDTKLSASKLLMPLSFASIFGGVCTLIGTSTNILVNSIAVGHNLPAFSMFEFSALGIVFLVVGTLYMVLVGNRLIPHRRTHSDLTRDFDMGDYLTDIVLLPSARSVGKRLAEAPLVQDMDIDVIGITRKSVTVVIPPPDYILQANDVLRVRCDVQKIRKLQDVKGVALKAGMKWRDQDLESEQAVLVEAVITPNSSLVGKSLKQLDFRATFGATALAIRRHGALLRGKLGRISLKAGDALLIEVKRDHLAQLKQHRAFVIASELPMPKLRKSRILASLFIIVGVVLTAALNIFPIVVSALIGCALLVLSKCISLEEAYQAIEWNIIFLLAGVITLGIALEKTGAAQVISNLMVSTIGAWGPVAMISAFYLLTNLTTEMMSNNATAALFAPIAIVTAETMGVDSRPFLIAVTFAASASFMTPVGYQTNTLIYGPGKYRFTDFLRVGAPLNLIFWLLSSFLIPRIWPVVP